MKKCLGMILALLCVTGCAGIRESGSGTLPAEEEPAETDTEQKEEMIMRMKINETAVEVLWEENASVQALREMAQKEPLTVRMSMYGGFEQVGPIGVRLPSSDVQTVTESGDIVLYSGSQIVIFYGSNSWAYTRLGHITDKSAAEMRELLGRGDVTVTISAEGTE